MIKKCLAVFLFVFMSLAAYAFEAHPLFSPLAGYDLDSKASKFYEFSSYTFRTASGSAGKQTVEGRLYKEIFRLRKGEQPAGSLYVVKNYVNAILNGGGELIFSYPNSSMATCRLVKNGVETWVEINPSTSSAAVYHITVLEKQAMVQEIKINPILKALNADGRITLYINFETGSFFVQPDSFKIIDEIVEMMNQNPSVKVSVEGHTDNTGPIEGNMMLSELRAQMIKYSLELKGIAPDRITAVGFGRTKPVADNSTEEGRAKNRRVELVKID